jgi:hypothetical protein
MMKLGSKEGEVGGKGKEISIGATRSSFYENTSYPALGWRLSKFITRHGYFAD